MDKIVVGIDLGTTFSSVAYVDDDGRPRVIPNADGKTSTPSAVLIQDGRIAVGDVAVNQWVMNEEHVVRWIKRAMGDSGYRFQGLSAVEISAEILKALKADAELHLGVSLDEAVITCPAYFAAIEIENTKRAGELAGFHVREIVKEPTAAAVYYGMEHMRDGEKVLVCDLGGGTFDATILAFEKGVFTPLASAGDRQLGGHDWTMELVAMVAERFQAKVGEDPRNDLLAGQILYEACEQAKRDFARVEKLAIPCQYQGQLESIPITRSEFEAKTEWRIQTLVMWSERALEKAQLAWGDIDRILLVGGSSRLRRMGLALEERSGRKPIPGREPDLMVALGAAILARGQMRVRKPAGGLVDAPGGGLVEVEYQRIIVRSLGTRVIIFENDKPHITNSPIIPQNKILPISLSREDYAVSSTGQKFFDVPVVEFESDDDYELIGNYQFQCLPKARRGDPIKVTFHYDISGIPTVEAYDLNTGQKLVGERLERLLYEDPDLSKIGAVRVRPRWVVFAVDTSGSMEGIKINEAKQALITNASNLLALGGEKCKIGIVSFSADVQIACHPTADIAMLKHAVASLTTSSTTSMDEGILKAVELVMAAPAGTDRDIVMLTDGMPDNDRRQSTLVAAEAARSRGVTLSSVGIRGGDVDEKFLQNLTPITLMIDTADGLSAAMTTLLTQSMAARVGGLTDTQKGRLTDEENA